MALTSLSVVIETSELPNFSEIVRQCELAGMVVEGRMFSLGVITGTMDSSRMTALGKIKGVRAVEPSREVRCLKQFDGSSQ